MKDWDARDLLPSIGQPVVILRGEDEELCSSSVESLRKAAPGGATIRTFSGAASYAHVDAWQGYLEVLDDFLVQHDGAAVTAAAAPSV